MFFSLWSRLPLAALCLTLPCLLLPPCRGGENSSVPTQATPAPKFQDGKLALDPAVMSTHPRLYLQSVDIEPLRAKLKSPAMAAQWSSFLQNAEGIARSQPPVAPPNTEDPFRGFGDRLPRLAFAWLMTGDSLYLEAAVRWIDAINTYPSWAGNEDLGAAHICFGMAVAYDWLYNDLTPEQRERIAQSLLQHGALLYTRGLRKPGSWWGYAYFQNHCWINYTGVAAVAAVLHEQNPPLMETWLNRTRAVFQIIHDHMGLDGSYHEGAAYLRYGTKWLLNYIEAIRSVSGEDLSDMPYLKKLPGHMLDTTMPDRKNLVHFSDTPVEAWGAVFDDEILPWLARHEQDGRAEWLREQNRLALGNNRYVSPFALIWFDPSVKPVDPAQTDTPTIGIYRDLGLVVCRTSWREDAAVMAFHCGPPGGQHIMDTMRDLPTASMNATFGHIQPDAGSYLFWSQGQWRICQPGQYTRDKLTSQTNTWLVGGFGQRGEAEWMLTDSYIGQPKQAHLVRVESSPRADYVVGEAAPAYQPGAQLLSYRRHLLFLKSDPACIVVFDRLQAAEPTDWASYLHAFGDFTLTGDDSFTITGAPSVFEGRTAPTKATLSPTYGRLFSSSPVSLATGPLTVLAHPSKKPTQMGHELIARLSPSPEVWMVQVISSDNRPAQLVKGDASTVSVRVGDDLITYDAEGEVQLNGQHLSDNLLPVPSHDDTR
ncbi:MAG: DUF4962 domain-containing protein [Opitutaceae bacterium]|jgi:hypothetical protein